eukprot:g3992.t1
MLEPTLKLVPPTEITGYPGIQAVRHAVARLEKLMFIAGQTKVADLLKDKDHTELKKSADELSKAFPETLPPDFGLFVNTMKSACLWTSATFALSKEACENPRAEDLQPQLSLYIKVKSFDMVSLEKILPSQQELWRFFPETGADVLQWMKSCDD